MQSGKCYTNVKFSKFARFFFSLVAQREQYIKDKQDQQEQYKRALSAQVCVHPTLTYTNCIAMHSYTSKKSLFISFHHNLNCVQNVLVTIQI